MSLDPTQQQSRSGEAGTPSNDMGTCVAGLMNTVAKGHGGVGGAPTGSCPWTSPCSDSFWKGKSGPLRRLAEALPVTLSRVSRVVTKMVGMGVMRRRRRRSDRRVVMLALTEEGKALTSELHRSVQADDARLSEGVSEEELAVFASVLSKVMANHTALQTGRNGNR